MKIIYLLRIFPLAILLSCSLTSCSQTGADGSAVGMRRHIAPSKIYKVGKPYKIKGIKYFPKEDFGYCRKGIASWYGPGFHGKRTAMGTRYDQHALTAAHKTLQLPCLAQVTNLQNGKKVIVEINDRGPYCRGREIDLSKKAADILGFTHKGTAPVEVKVLPKESKILAGKAKPTRHHGRHDHRHTPLPRPELTDEDHLVQLPHAFASSSQKGKLFVQAGAFSSRENAQTSCNLLKSVGNAIVVPVTNKKATLYRVRVGPLVHQADADQVLEKVVQKGFNNANIVVENQL